MTARIPIAAVALSLVAIPSTSLADARLKLTGKVTDAAGKPLDRATVLVYQAGVKHGYSTFCPSCYSDCGKRTLTDSAGNFTIPGLSSELYFELLVIHDGYMPEFVKKVDPGQSTPTAVLRPRAAIIDEPRRRVRGRVVDKDQNPIPDAVVSPQGLQGRLPDGQYGSIYGTVSGLEPVAVTNERGEFELVHTEPFDAIAVEVEARGMAPKIFTALRSGAERHTLTVTEGATIRGRLVQDGKPVANAQIGLIAREHGWTSNLIMVGYPLPEIRIGTNDDGTFAISNVPPGVDWYLYGKMESLAARGGAPVVDVTTKGDGVDINAGDLPLVPAFRLRGKVTLSDGKPIRAGMRIGIGSDRAFDTQSALLASDGSFEISGLPKGSYTVFPSVRGYRYKASQNGDMPLKIDGDVDGFAMTLDPR